MIDYLKTKIYKIESHLGDKVYIGSTTNEYLSQRFQNHKSSYKRWKQEKPNSFTTSFLLFDEYGVDNCQIVLIEECKCNSKDEKNAKEGHYIKAINCVNKNIMGLSPEETDILNENREIPREIIKQRIISKRYYERHKEAKKQKYQENKDELKLKALEYYKNKYNTNEEFKQKRKEYMKEYQRKKRETRTI
jgi:hypothetical protein